MKDNQPLVSIIVITYNSAEYVLETLDSAKLQTYRNIELIVSDDGSKDDTLEICKTWVAENKERFVNTEILTVGKNTGIPANCNRGVKASQGKWIKLIAGDDLLLEDCLKNNITFAKANNCKFIISNMKYFSKDVILKDYGNIKEIKYFFSKKSAIEKYRTYLRTGYFLNSPSFFYLREIYDLNGGFDESFRLLEDKPFIIKTLKSKVNICFLEKTTVKYRVSRSSSSGRKNSLLIEDIMMCNETLVFPILKVGNFKDKIFYFILKFKDAQNIKSSHVTLGSKISNKIYYFIRLYS